ncbi:hypothetical protein [Candidatus Odyssella thessalonicensis]|uniref:hypothetical protein n=1 Tax=Candidatus Odyssella thessalonicensis TaxID=84647 RepID=UPI000225A954|nr:hypothetical protein [Candidatus Odyssella thessalonicensis]
MFRKMVFSTAALSLISLAPSGACEALSENPIIKYEDCFKKVGANFQSRLKKFEQEWNGKGDYAVQRQLEIKELKMLSLHEQEQCRKTCVDAPDRIVEAKK